MITLGEEADLSLETGEINSKEMFCNNIELIISCLKQTFEKAKPKMLR